MVQIILKACDCGHMADLSDELRSWVAYRVWGTSRHSYICQTHPHPSNKVIHACLAICYISAHETALFNTSKCVNHLNQRCCVYLIVVMMHNHHSPPAASTKAASTNPSQPSPGSTCPSGKLDAKKTSPSLHQSCPPLPPPPGHRAHR